MIRFFVATFGCILIATVKLEIRVATLARTMAHQNQGVLAAATAEGCKTPRGSLRCGR